MNGSEMLVFLPIILDNINLFLCYCKMVTHLHLYGYTKGTGVGTCFTNYRPFSVNTSTESDCTENIRKHSAHLYAFVHLNNGFHTLLL